MLTLVGRASANNRVLVVEGLTDWITSLHMFPRSGIVGAQGTMQIADAVKRVVRCGIAPSRIVVVLDHDPPEKPSVIAAGRKARAQHPEISVLRPAAEGTDLSDGWQEHGPAWRAQVAAAVRDVAPGAVGEIAAPPPVLAVAS